MTVPFPLSTSLPISDDVSLGYLPLKRDQPIANHIQSILPVQKQVALNI